MVNTTFSISVLADINCIACTFCLIYSNKSEDKYFMVAMTSLVLGAVSQNLSAPMLLKKVSAQEFIRDEVLVISSLDPNLQIAHANKILLSGKSLTLDASERAMLNLQC